MLQFSALRLPFSALRQWESAACRRVNALNRRPLLSSLFGAASRLGNGWVWYALMFALPFVDGRRGAAVAGVIAINGLLCTWAYKWLKRTTHRPRPHQVFASIYVTEQPLDHFSFPSGHTLHAVAFTIIACAYYPALAWVLVPFTALVAVSRPVLGLHYPSDVIAGACIGAATSWTALWCVAWCGIPHLT